MMITKEIWKKKQLIKIAYTNKSFSKSLKMVKESRNKTIDAGNYGYGKGIWYTEELDPKDDFMYESKKPNLNGSFNSSSRGVSITPATFKRSIQEEAAEIEKLKNDVDEIDEKIELEMHFFDAFNSNYKESKLIYEDKKSTVDDLIEFHRWIEEQKDMLDESIKEDKGKIIDKFISEEAEKFGYAPSNTN